MDNDRFLHVLTAEAVSGHRLHLEFDDATTETVDLRPLLEGPIFEPLQGPAYFARVVVDPVCGTVAWPNGADLAPEALYELLNEEIERKVS